MPRNAPPRATDIATAMFAIKKPPMVPRATLKIAAAVCRRRSPIGRVMKGEEAPKRKQEDEDWRNDRVEHGFLH